MRMQGHLTDTDHILECLVSVCQLVGTEDNWGQGEANASVASVAKVFPSRVQHLE